MAKPDLSWKVEGFSEFEKKLAAMDDKLAKKGIREALRAGGRVVEEAIVADAPKRTGFLAKHFGHRLSFSKVRREAKIMIGPEGKVDYPDLPTGKYRTKINKKGKAIKVGRIAVVQVVRFLEFGTSKMGKKPFMTQAFGRSVAEALNKISQVLKEYVEEHQ